MLKDKTEEIVALKRLKMEKEEGFPITSLREIDTVLKGGHENIVTVRGCHSVQDFNCLNPVHECIGWCIMLKDKKTAKIVALKRLKMEKEKGFPITSLREINTVLKGGHENIVTVRGCRRVEDFNCLNPVHKHIEWRIMLKDKKTAKIVALKRLKMEKEKGFPITSFRKINTVLKGGHENIVTVRGCHSVEDFNCLNPVHERIEWCIMLKDKRTAKIVALKRLKMEKGFPITSLREIKTLLKGQHENIVTVKDCHSVEDFNCLNPVHEHIGWCILLKDKKTAKIVALKRLKMEKEGFPFTSLREINTVLKGQHENIVTVKGCRSVEDFNCLNPVHEDIEWCILLKDKKTAEIVALKRLKMEKEGFPITSLREIKTVLKGRHENIVTVKGCHSVENFNCLNPVHEDIEWCILLKNKKTEEMVALKRLKMEKEGFPFTSLKEIKTLLKGQDQNIVTVKGCHSVEDFNCLNPVHEHTGGCIMLKDKKTAEIVALKRLKMEKEEGFPFTSLREINTVLKGQHENIVTVKGCHNVEDFNCLNPVHEDIEWFILLKNKKTEEMGL